ncbi:uncharacterized protein LOC136083546 [Hydra vulgaris]|uniref:Uncharacterized protein LOC136083546 n=1 Tax=Hydra vulgaris TaxID=6087 RepID=A0ABM4CBH6_HYDVU
MTWHDLIKRFKGSFTIDAVQQRQMDETTKHWRHVLERLFSIKKFHGSHNVGLRGTSNKLCNDNNGCFLKIVELLSKFDPVMKEHIRRIKNKEIYSHYLGKNIQNEIIQILSKAVKEKIVVDLKASKYYSIIVDFVNDAAGSFLDAVTLFDIVQHLFVFFSSSTQRWNVLREFVEGLTLKGLRETRLANRIDALKSLRHQLREIIQALKSFWNIELPVSSVTATKNKSESRALLQKIDFKFVCCLITWYDVLSQLEITSKSLQEVNLNTPQAVH